MVEAQINGIVVTTLWPVYVCALLRMPWLEAAAAASLTSLSFSPIGWRLCLDTPISLPFRRRSSYAQNSSLMDSSGQDACVPAFGSGSGSGSRFSTGFRFCARLCLCSGRLGDWRPTADGSGVSSAGLPGDSWPTAGRGEQARASLISLEGQTKRIGYNFRFGEKLIHFGALSLRRPNEDENVTNSSHPLAELKQRLAFFCSDLAPKPASSGLTAGTSSPIVIMATIIIYSSHSSGRNNPTKSRQIQIRGCQIQGSSSLNSDRLRLLSGAAAAGRRINWTCGLGLFDERNSLAELIRIHPDADSYCVAVRRRNPLRVLAAAIVIYFFLLALIADQSFTSDAPNATRTKLNAAQPDQTKPNQISVRTRENSICTKALE